MHNFNFNIKKTISLILIGVIFLNMFYFTNPSKTNAEDLQALNIITCVTKDKKGCDPKPWELPRLRPRITNSTIIGSGKDTKVTLNLEPSVMVASRSYYIHYIKYDAGGCEKYEAYIYYEPTSYTLYKDGKAVKGPMTSDDFNKNRTYTEIIGDSKTNIKYELEVQYKRTKSEFVRSTKEPACKDKNALLATITAESPDKFNIRSIEKKVNSDPNKQACNELENEANNILNGVESYLNNLDRLCNEQSKTDADIKALNDTNDILHDMYDKLGKLLKEPKYTTCKDQRDKITAARNKIWDRTQAVSEICAKKNLNWKTWVNKGLADTIDMFAGNTDCSKTCSSLPIAYKYVCESICWIGVAFMKLPQCSFLILQGAISIETSTEIAPIKFYECLTGKKDTSSTTTPGTTPSPGGSTSPSLTPSPGTTTYGPPAPGEPGGPYGPPAPPTP